MRDPVAYRIRYTPHPHAGDKWCIYPTYDYTHCIIDSLENITHSLCTLEFEIRRESYYWLLEALDLYRPFVWEYSRLNITYNVLSKRKLEKLVNEKIVSGWDDPRLFTLNGLRRRGYTPTMINEFCNEIGVSRKGNENVTSIKLLEFFARKELDREAPRTFGVLDPILL
jgi:glutaminyl-tRNA synthetase